MRVFLLKDSSDGSIEAELALVDPYMADDVHKNSIEGDYILERKDCSVNLFLSHPHRQNTYITHCLHMISYFSPGQPAFLITLME